MTAHGDGLIEAIGRELEQSAAVKRELGQQAPVIAAIAEIWADALRSGNKIVFFGNGGSAADAQHLAGELMGRFCHDREPLAAIALSADTVAITAIGNDYGYEFIFARQVQGLVRAGDVVVAISTSGESQNVLAAVEAARQLGATIVAFTGNQNTLKDVADQALAVPARDAARIQEGYMTVGHIICGLVESLSFREQEAWLGVRR